ncbi:MAG: hypothetical protein NT027_04825, partial [Proteobacteria bacterium]|nr:hypothetical protein [Pseudomonadota bacterium]
MLLPMAVDMPAFAQVAGVGNTKDIVLAEPSELTAVPTVLRSLDGLFVGQDYILAFNSTGEEYTKIPFTFEAKTREQRFGKYVDVERIKVPNTKLPGQWKGVLFPSQLPKADRRSFWDATMLQVAQVFLKDQSIIQSRSIPNDLIRPAADRLGEPTKKETSRVRADFKSKYRKVFGSRYTGMSKVPLAWESKNSQSDHYLVASKIESYPLLMMACDKSDETSCLLDRVCYLEGGPKSIEQSLSGVVAYQSKSGGKYV